MLFDFFLGFKPLHKHKMAQPALVVMAVSAGVFAFFINFSIHKIEEGNVYF